VTTVSPATEGDLPGIARLERQIEGDSAADIDTLRARLHMFPPGFLAAREHGGIIGYIETCLWDEPVPRFGAGPGFFSTRHRPDGAILYIIFVGVRADRRRHGVGTALLRGVFPLADGRPIQAVCRDRHIGFYRQAGFVRKRSLPGFLPGGPFHLMERPPEG